MNEEARKYIDDLREKFERECNGPGDLKRRQELLTNARHAITISDEDFTKVEMEHAAFKTHGSFEFGFYVGARWADEHQKSPWISTKERLPMVVSYNYTEGDNAVHDSEIEDTCLCHLEGGMGSYSSEYFIGHLESEYVDNNRDSLYWADDPGNIICWVDEVDYYMPLPNCRKETTNE